MWLLLQGNALHMHAHTHTCLKTRLVVKCCLYELWHSRKLMVTCLGNLKVIWVIIVVAISIIIKCYWKLPSHIRRGSTADPGTPREYFSDRRRVQLPPYICASPALLAPKLHNKNDVNSSQAPCVTPGNKLNTRITLPSCPHLIPTTGVESFVTVPIPDTRKQAWIRGATCPKANQWWAMGVGFHPGSLPAAPEPSATNRLWSLHPEKYSPRGLREEQLRGRLAGRVPLHLQSPGHHQLVSSGDSAGHARPWVLLKVQAPRSPVSEALTGCMFFMVRSWDLHSALGLTGLSFSPVANEAGFLPFLPLRRNKPPRRQLLAECLSKPVNSEAGLQVGSGKLPVSPSPTPVGAIRPSRLGNQPQKRRSLCRRQTERQSAGAPATSRPGRHPGRRHPPGLPHPSPPSTARASQDLRPHDARSLPNLPSPAVCPGSPPPAFPSCEPRYLSSAPTCFREWAPRSDSRCKLQT